MYFLKRNWKNLIVFALCVICLVLWICTIRTGSVDQTQRISRSVAGMETPIPAASGSAVFNSPELSQSDPATISSNESGTSDNNPDNNDDKAKQKDNKNKNNKDKEKPGKIKKTETTPAPTEKPKPVKKDDQAEDKDWFYVYLSIDCKKILDHMDDLTEGLENYVGDGTILKKTKVKCYKGESVWDVLLRECKARGINLESEYTATYGAVYVEAINNIAEFDCGELSGWCYSVDGWYPNYGASKYILKESEEIKWRYTCDLGRDLGANVNK